VTVEMKNFKMLLEYDGTHFHGWQRQRDVRTVQGVLEAAASDLFGEPIIVNGCCRTDAGVHAWGFVGNFRTDTPLEPERVRRALSARLPEDVVVRHVDEAHAEFHARHDCIARRYVYRITTAPTAIFRRILTYTRYPLEVEPMAEAARVLVGEHDFTSFAPIATAGEVPTVCNVMQAALTRDESVITFEIKADRFLHHMVRNIVGTLVEVGRGRFRPEQVGEILRKKDRRAAGPTAPACGLALSEACYPEQDGGGRAGFGGTIDVSRRS
jgi:tRNA pseudouridine38-40 synthase